MNFLLYNSFRYKSLVIWFELFSFGEFKPLFYLLKCLVFCFGYRLFLLYSKVFLFCITLPTRMSRNPVWAIKLWYFIHGSFL